MLYLLIGSHCEGEKPKATSEIDRAQYHFHA